MQKISSIKVFSDLGDAYVCGKASGAVNDCSIVTAGNGTNIITIQQGCLYTFLESDDCATGTKAVKTDILSSHCSALRNSDSTFSILCAVGRDIYLVTQQGDALSSPIRLDVASPQDGQSLVSFVPIQVGSLYKVLTVWSTRDEAVWALACFEICDGHVSKSMDTGLVADSPSVSWVECSGEYCVAYTWQGRTCVDVAFPDYDSARRKSSVDKGRFLGAFEKSLCFISDDGVISALSAQNPDEVEWVFETGDGQIDGLEAVTFRGTVHLFLHSSASGILYHCPLVCDKVSGRLVVLPLSEGVSSFSADAANDSIDLCVVTKSGESCQVTHSSLSFRSSTWRDNPVVFDSEDEVRPLTGHMSEITLLDKDGNPLSSQPVMLWTNAETRLFINGLSVKVSSENRYKVVSNESGQIEVIEESDSIQGTPVILQECAQDGEGAGLFFTITPGEKYRRKFKTIGKDELGDTRLSDGTMLVDADYGDQKDSVLEQASTAMHSMLEGALVSDNPDLNRIRQGDYDPRMSIFTEDPTELLSRIVKGNGHKSFVLRFDSDMLTYREISADESFSRIQTLCRSCYGEQCNVIDSADKLSADNGLFSSIASFFKAVVKGIVKVVEVVVHAVEEAVTAVVNFVSNAVSQVASFAVDLIEDAVHLVESVLKQITVTVRKIIKWIGFMLDWDDIKKCAKAVEAKFEAGFDLIDSWLVSLDGSIDKLLDGAELKVKDFLGLFGTALSDDSVRNQAVEFEDSPYNQASSHNVFAKCLGSDCHIDAPELISTISDDLESIGKLVSSVTDGLDFHSLVDNLLDNSFSIRSIGCFFRDLLGKLVDALVSASRAVAHMAISATRTLLSDIRRILTCTVRIPLLSGIAKLVTGMDLSILNLASFAVALPLTVSYKLIYNKAPVPDVMKLDEFDKSMAIFCATLYGTCQTVGAGLLCYKQKLALMLPSVVELLTVAGFCACTASAFTETTRETAFFSALAVVAAFQCAVDVSYSKRFFRTDNAFYSIKLFIALGGALGGLIWMVMGKKMLYLAVPGSLLFSIHEAFKCFFYYNRTGQWKVAVALAGTVAVTSVAIDAIEL